METPILGNITQALGVLGSGNDSAAAALLPLVYQELRALAAAHFKRENPGNTLQPTVLVHEAYLRLVERSAPKINDRAHFFRLASKLMRQLLVDHAREKAAQKRGADRDRVTLSGIDTDSLNLDVDFVDLEEALLKLTAISERRSELVELRFFGGLTVEEASESLGISVETAKREWRLAKAWLARALSRDDAP